ncbi:MAG: DUF2059 domain-containing protein [Desulfobacteraceae bacterium]|jgi:hypothetical protein
MKYVMLVLCSVFILSCQHAPEAPVVAEKKPAESAQAIHALTRELMAKCGINEQLENVPEKTMAEVRECFKRNETILGKMSEQVITDINGIIGRSFNPDTIRAILAEYIESQMSPDDMRSVIAWLDSPLGLKLTAIEKTASTPESYRAMVEAVPTLKQTPDYDERIKLVQEIDASVKATDLIVDRMINMQIITLTALGSAFPSMSLPPEQTMRENFEKNRTEISGAIGREIALSILFTYRDVSKAELKEYIRFMKTDYGTRYHNVIQEGSNKAYTFCGKKFSDAVVKRIKSKEPDEEATKIAPSSPVHPQQR